MKPNGNYSCDPTACDFCLRAAENLNPINDGLWAICNACYVKEYEYSLLAKEEEE